MRRLFALAVLVLLPNLAIAADDAKFQLIGSTNAMGNWVTNFYNATDGTLSTRTDAGGTTSYAYDTYGQLSLISYPASLGSEGFLNKRWATG